MANHPRYDLRSVKLPRVAGRTLRVLTDLMERPGTRGLVISRMLATGGIRVLREGAVSDPPTYLPFAPHEAPGARTTPVDLDAFLEIPRAGGPGFSFATVGDYARAYRAGAVTPVEIAERVLAAIAASDARSPPLRSIIASDRDDVMAQARASTQRLRDGRPVGVFEGVPVAVKDELDMVPYGTTVGTRFLGKTPATEDATVVARMRSAGAILIGKSNMHEIGIGVTGLNPHHGTPRNPYGPDHFTGGSSSGSAAAVAAGLCPVALGADGGGSIRIPSGFCGLVGLSPTYGRVSAFGTAPLAWTVDRYGPIASTALDAALAYATIAGADASDPCSLRQPPVRLEGFDDLDLGGLTLGVYPPWFEHASAAMVEGCRSLLRELERMGARVVEVEIPELEAARLAHVATILTEMATAMEMHDRAHRGDMGLDVRTNLALGRALTSRDYVQAQRIRTRTIGHFERVLREVDAIVTPATGCTAPRIPPDALPHGESDISTVFEIMRFTTAANLTGHPAIVFPAAYDGAGLPVGLQAIGRYWHEHTLLRLAHAAERVLERRAPEVHYPLLP